MADPITTAPSTQSCPSRRLLRTTYTIATSASIGQAIWNAVIANRVPAGMGSEPGSAGVAFPDTIHEV
jgi:hypothetical protein